MNNFSFLFFAFIFQSIFFSVLIQLMSASELQRDIVYYTFKDAKTVLCLTKLYEIIEANNLTVGDMYQLLLEYNDYINSLKRLVRGTTDICNFMLKKFNSKNN